jgi:hypothetical protein
MFTLSSPVWNFYKQVMELNLGHVIKYFRAFSLSRVLEAAVSASLVGSTDPMADNLTFLLRDSHTNTLGIPGQEPLYSLFKCKGRKFLFVICT